jgi:hypothetical protein
MMGGKIHWQEEEEIIKTNKIDKDTMCSSSSSSFFFWLLKKLSAAAVVVGWCPPGF